MLSPIGQHATLPASLSDLTLDRLTRATLD
jgi:hypothetical protein